ncbi:MAG: IclR family transcriptional regulator [Actinomycetota bacterium]
MVGATMGDLPSDGDAVLPPDSVLGKVGLILDAFSAEEPTLGVSELCRVTGVPKATVFRLTRDLTALGMLDRDGSRYRLGLRLFELGSLVHRQRLLHDLAMPFLQDLRARTDETVHLGIPADGEVIYLARLAGHQTHTAPSRIAGRTPMHCTATGKAMLANLPDALRAEVLAKPLTAETPYTIVVRSVLDQELERVRAAGFAVENEELALQFRSVAAPVFGPGGRLLGAVSVTGPTSRITAEATAGPVRAAAAGISDAAAVRWELA